MAETTNSVELHFGDGEYLFRFGLTQFKELQDKCKAGLGAIFARVTAGRYFDNATNEGFGNPLEAQYYVEDLYEIIRLGLIGGGRGMVGGESVTVDPLVARRLVDRYVVGRPLKEPWSVAAAVMMAVCEGYEPPKKVEPGSDPAAATTQTDGSITPTP